MKSKNPNHKEDSAQQEIEYACVEEGCNQPAMQFSCYCEDCTWEILEEDMIESEDCDS